MVSGPQPGRDDLFLQCHDPLGPISALVHSVCQFCFAWCSLPPVSVIFFNKNCPTHPDIPEPPGPGMEGWRGWWKCKLALAGWPKRAYCQHKSNRSSYMRKNESAQIVKPNRREFLKMGGLVAAATASGRPPCQRLPARHPKLPRIPKPPKPCRPGTWERPAIASASSVWVARRRWNAATMRKWPCPSSTRRWTWE